MLCGTTGGCDGVAEGEVVAESRHYPYGEERWTSGTLPTDYRFTGQLFQASLGIYRMGARWYDPALGRWLSADTIVPEPGNPQAFNRYSWVLNNPLRFVDPSGHGDKNVIRGAGDDIPDELRVLYDELGLQDEMSFTEFLMLIDLAHKLLPDITGGMRAEGTYWLLPPFVAIDVNLDFVGNLREMDGRILGSAGLQGGFGVGGSVNFGPVVGLDETSLEEWDRIMSHVGGTASDDALLGLLSSEVGGILALLGFEGDYGWGSKANGEEHRPQSFFLGLAGVGEEGSPLWVGTHLFDMDVLSGEASLGVGDWKLHFNLYKLADSLETREE